jgi:hypothetical protein
MIYYQISKTYPKKLGQAADEIFRVAAWTRSELAGSRGRCVGQADAEKLAQRSSVAAACAGSTLLFKFSADVCPSAYQTHTKRISKSTFTSVVIRLWKRLLVVA